MPLSVAFWVIRCKDGFTRPGRASQQGKWRTQQRRTRWRRRRLGMAQPYAGNLPAFARKDPCVVAVCIRKIPTVRTMVCRQVSVRFAEEIFLYALISLSHAAFARYSSLSLSSSSPRPHPGVAHRYYCCALFGWHCTRIHCCVWFGGTLQHSSVH